MHSLEICKLCGKVFNGQQVPGEKGVCLDCLSLLEAKYSQIHCYIRDNKEEARFDPAYLAKMTGVRVSDIKLLISMGYLERDMQTWSTTPSERSILARKFEQEIDKMIEERRITTYGGKIYKRKTTDGGGGHDFTPLGIAIRILTAA